MNVGPTDRIGLFEGVEAVGAVSAGLVWGASAFAAEFFFCELLSLVGCEIFRAPSSVTMMSPCWAAVALSSSPFSASAHVWPAALHEHDGLNSWRYRNAFGDDE